MLVHLLHTGLGGAFVNPKRILVALTLALFASGVCTWLVSRKLTAQPASQKLPDVRYASPSRPLQAGEVLRPDNIELIAWPGSLPIDGAFARSADVIGRAVLFPLAKGQPILDRDLSAPGSGAGLASKIPDGMRAVALRSDEIVGVAGFLAPGSHLDVLVTYHMQDSPDPITATVLQNAVVIAAGHQIEPDPEGKTADVTVVTLLLTPEEAERAVLASTQGAIHFVLRNGGDASHTADPPIQLSQLATARTAIATRALARPTAVRAPTPPAPKSHEIETILGGTSAPQAGGPGQ
jgi:pilus assembly protein CpaB